MRAALVLAIGIALAAAASLSAGGRLLVVTDPLPARADAIVILAGSVPDRVLEAADLYHAGVAPRVVVTREHSRAGDGALHARGVRLPEGDDLTLIALRQLGVPETAILLLRRRATSTETEARTVARWACRANVERLVVVTSRAHTRRARLILARALGPRIALAIRPSRYDDFSPRRWWHARRDAKIVLSEWEKLVHYWLDERWTIRSCGGLAVRHAGRRLREIRAACRRLRLGSMATPDQIRRALESALPGARIVVADTTGGGDHFDVQVVAAAFAGKTLVEQHQLVYGALGALMPSIHALSLKTTAA